MKKKLFSGFLAIALVVIMLVSLLATGAFAASDATATGRTFTGDNAATGTDSRLELTKPINEVPLTFEATVKVTGTGALSKGTIFGQYGGKKNGHYNCFANFEIHTDGPALCFAPDANDTAIGSVNFGKNGVAIAGEGGATNTFADHIGEWVTVTITAVPTATANNYDFFCYINGELAYEKMNANAYFDEQFLATSQTVNRFAIGSNVASTVVNFPGAIRDVALYRKTLTADEVRASYTALNDGTGKAYATDLILAYDMSTVDNPYYERDISGNGYDACRADRAYIVKSEGRTFSTDKLTLTNNLTEMPLTIEAEFRTTASGTTVFGNTTTSSVACLNFEIYSSAPALCFPVDETGKRGSVIFANALIGGVNPYKNNEFNHVVITATPTVNENEYTFDCYLNGVKAYNSITKTAILDIDLIQSVNPLNIGANGNTGNAFNGNIRGINLYNRALSATEIASAYAVGTTYSGLIASYDMTDYGHIRNPHFEPDLSGNGYHAQRTAVSGLTFTQDNVSKPLYVHNLFDKMPRTIEATVYTTQARGCVIFGNYAGKAGSNIDLEIYTGGVPAMVIMNGGNTYSVQFKNYTVKTGEWVHLVAVNEMDKNGNAVYVLYANGIEVDRVTDKPTYVTLDMQSAQTVTRKFAIGTDGNATSANAFFHGNILDVAVYSRALTADEVRYSYENGVDKYNDSLMAYYDMKTVAGMDFIQDLSGNNHHASRNDYTAVEGGKWFNLDDERLAVVKDYEDAPLTIEATVYVPSTLKQANTIFGNLYARDYINFEIYTNGNPALVINEIPENKANTSTAGYTHSVIFDIDVRREAWVHLAVVYDRTKTGLEKYALYVDGVKVESYALSSSSYDAEHLFELDMKWIQRAIPFTLGRNASKCFQGKIKSLALYSAPLSAQDILSSFTNGVNTEREELFAYYNLDNPENTDSLIKDETGNGYDFGHRFFEDTVDDSDTEYSFAFVGDTQFLVYKDIQEGTTKYTKPIYDWLIKNKDEKNIKYVFGLGDITDQNLDSEYDYAQSLFRSLGEAGIDYAAISGNHDGTFKDDYERFNSVFATDTYLNNGIVLMQEGSYLNYYKNFEVNGHKYMVLVLEYGLPKYTDGIDVAQWANSVVEANSDRQVIVLTHGYLGYDGGFLNSEELHSPEISTKFFSDRTLRSGEAIWSDFVSLHENIIISACGHIDPYNIKQRHDVGVNGNIVHQFLIDNQALDKTFSYDTGMVAMFYFSNGGKDVRVEYVSATKSLRAQQTDSSAPDVLFGKNNQFSFTLDNQVAQDVSTEYGIIPRVYTNLDQGAVVLFKADKSFVGAYGLFDKALAKLIATDTDGDYVILLRDDARMSAKVGMGNFTGRLTVDLGGHELKIDENGNYLLDIYVNNASAPVSDYTFKNGSITKVHGHGIIDINYGTSLTADANIGFVFDGVTFRSISRVKNTNVIFTTWEAGAGTATGGMNVTSVFNNCTFDLAGSVTGSVMLPLTYNSKTGVVHTVTVNGGNVYASEANPFASGFYTADDLDNLTFGRTDGGKYTSLTLPRGVSAPVTEYNGLVFKKVACDAATDTYRLVPGAVANLEFTPKVSITLDANLILKIYIPENEYLTGFTLDGKPYTVGELTATDGYYTVAIELDAKMAGREVALEAGFEVDSDSYLATYTFSTLKYARKLLADEGATPVTKTLVCNMLAYVKSAYTYFGTEGASEIASAIDAIIGTGASSFEKISDTNGSMAVGAGVNGVTFILDAEPRVRFYFAQGTDLTNYAFKIDGVAQKFTATSEAIGENNFVCADISLFAYKMIGTVEVYNGSTKLGSFHINDYYDFALEQNNSALTEVVERFYEYCKSAKAYRDEVKG